MSDRLAKSFDKHLSLAARNDNSLRRRLRDYGWKDFVNSEHPKTENPIEMAAGAVIYIGISDGHWRYEPIIIVAVIAFLREHIGEPKANLAKLDSVLREVPVDNDKVMEWFNHAYRTKK